MQLSGLGSRLWQTLRIWRRHWPPIAAALIIFSLSVGAGIAIYDAADSLLLQPLPYRRPHQLVTVTAQIYDGYHYTFPDSGLNRVFSSFAAYVGFEGVLATDHGSEAIHIAGSSQPSASDSH
ncbi:MAG: hypothetical protein ACRD2H_15450 [Terriglobales bacterium]